VTKTKLKVALSKGHSPTKKESLNLSDGDIESTDILEEGTKTLPATKKGQLEDIQAYHNELIETQEQLKKYSEKAMQLERVLVEARVELEESNKMLELRDSEIELLKKFVSKETMDELEQIVKGMTEEIEVLRKENEKLKTTNPTELQKENEALNSKIKELEEEIKTMHKDRNTLIEGAKTKIGEERQRFLGLSKKLEDFQEQLLAAR
jgi:chromosome segregation ATPase